LVPFSSLPGGPSLPLSPYHDRRGAPSLYSFEVGRVSPSDFFPSPIHPFFSSSHRAPPSLIGDFWAYLLVFFTGRLFPSFLPRRRQPILYQNQLKAAPLPREMVQATSAVFPFVPPPPFPSSFANRIFPLKGFHHPPFYPWIFIRFVCFRSKGLTARCFGGVFFFFRVNRFVVFLLFASLFFFSPPLPAAPAFFCWREFILWVEPAGLRFDVLFPAPSLLPFFSVPGSFLSRKGQGRFRLQDRFFFAAMRDSPGWMVSLALFPK